MLVFISDLHLVDGTTGNTVDLGQFSDFADALRRIVHSRDADIRDLTVVFLGDIFDLIRTDRWFDTAIRPWSADTERDLNGCSLREYAREIFERILRNPVNAQGLDILRQCKADLGKTLPVSFRYVIGNHDWLVNRYPELRVQAAEILGLDDPEGFRDELFAESFLDAEHGVLARHGDRYDWENYDGTRNASSLGDALVIELYSRFPRRVEAVLREHGVVDEPLIRSLEDIDNVRPIHELPAWLDAVCRRSCCPDAVRLAKTVWSELVRAYFRIPFVVGHDAWGPDRFDLFKLLFELGPGWTMEKAMTLLERLSLTHYPAQARKEEDLSAGRARFVVYGHTHVADIQPMGFLRSPGGVPGERMYFNTGTWRRMLRRSQNDDGSTDFVGWQVMTYLAFFRTGEMHGQAFQLWNVTSA